MPYDNYCLKGRIFAQVLSFRQLVALSFFPQATLSLTCGYEDVAFQAKPTNNLFCKK
ncbi:MAG: hypothetical protein LBT56_01485 [Prevotellaceae bacterium]|nr:hypothetical protein [Prevotellaceae bacterium]